jgi:hypothetical protein
MITLKKAVVVLMLALSALPAFAQGIPTDPDGDGIPTGRDVCPLAYGSGSDGCPSGNYATRRSPTLNVVGIETISDFQLNDYPIIEK